MMRRAAIVRLLLKRNGLRWLIFFACAEFLRRVSAAFNRGLESFERSHSLPGFYDADAQRAIWNQYDWSRKGEEWTASDVWKASVVNSVLKPEIEGGDIVEIGPGAGRWSVELQKIARRLTVVDVSSSCIEQTKLRLGDAQNVRFIVNDGRTLPLEAEAFDRAWSFDVFVHVSDHDTATYLKELARVLKGGGRAIIHHPADGGLRGPWRTRMSSERFAELARAAGLRVIRQFDSWEHAGERFHLRETGDAITVLEKPNA